MSFKLKSDETGNLHLVGEEMPCGPRQIMIWRWVMPNTLGRMEREEAAARLLVFSIHFGAWVGVSFPRICEMCLADIELQRNATAIQQANYTESERVAKANWRRKWLNFLTLGWYGRMYPEQKALVMNIPDVPMSGIYLFGPQHIVTGFQELRDDGMVRIENVDGQEIIYPTPKLIQRIMEVQRIAA